MLVAHHGFAFDYFFLMAEINRHNLEEIFGTIDLWFADTLYDVRRVSSWALPVFHYICIHTSCELAQKGC